MTPPATHTDITSVPLPTNRATTDGFMKMPDPTMPPMTMRAASRVPRRRSSLGEACDHVCISDVLPHHAGFYRGASTAARRPAARYGARPARRRPVPGFGAFRAQGVAGAPDSRDADRADRPGAVDGDDDAG